MSEINQIKVIQFHPVYPINEFEQESNQIQLENFDHLRLNDTVIMFALTLAVDLHPKAAKTGQRT
jgi:hypothetical protein